MPRWSEYYQAVAGRPPKETLLKAIENHAADLPGSPAAAPGSAIDLGCGDGRDTVALTRRSWLVIAIDGEPEAIARLQQRQDIDKTNLIAQHQRFENLILSNPVDLINASFCLPFCPSAQFPTLWAKIVKSLRSGGRFCGHLFGDRDSWASYPDRTHHTRSQIDQLLSPFVIAFLDEEEHTGKTALGEQKDWHICNIVARKPL